MSFFLKLFLKEDLADLKEQINLYENAVKYGVIGLDQSEDWENQLSDSCMDLGLKKANKKNGLHRYIITFNFFDILFVQDLCRYTDIIFLLDHLKNLKKTNLVWNSMAVAHLSDSKLPKDESLRLLRVEMQRCLGSLKGKRQKISQLQEELRLCQGQVNELQTQVDEAKLSAMVRTPALLLFWLMAMAVIQI